MYKLRFILYLHFLVQLLLYAFIGKLSLWELQLKKLIIKHMHRTFCQQVSLKSLW